MTDTAFTRAGVPDPAEDFEGCLQALADAHLREIEGLTPAEKDDFYLRSSAGRLAQLIEIDAPDVIVDMAERR